MSVGEARESNDLPDFLYSVGETKFPKDLFEVVTNRYNDMTVTQETIFISEDITVEPDCNLLFEVNEKTFQLRYVGFAQGEGIILKQEVNFDDDTESYILIKNATFRLLMENENAYGLSLSLITEF